MLSGIPCYTQRRAGEEDQRKLMVIYSEGDGKVFGKVQVLFLLQ